MSQIDELRRIIATMLMLPANQIRPDVSLAPLDTSLGGTRLRLALKRLGLSLPSGPLPARFGDLEAVVFGTEIATVSSDGCHLGKKPVDFNLLHGILRPNEIRIGLDVQDVRSLPVTADYWEEQFYVDTFGKSEIAYAVVQSEPRTHLAGFWCAKEALRKCDTSFADVGFASTIVEHDSTGKPYLVCQDPSGSARLPHAVSLSHTSEVATAVVIQLPPVSEAKKTELSSTREVESSASLSRTGSRRLLKILSASAFLIFFVFVVLFLIRHFHSA